jgi:SAM-dependent methyltransferase
MNARLGFSMAGASRVQEGICEMGKTEERDYHDQYVTSGGVRSLERSFYSSEAKARENALAFGFLGDLGGKRLLFYGSGGHFSLVRDFARRGAEVIAIDISPETIAKLVAAIVLEGLESQCTAVVMDCESLDLEDESVDVVFARSIIHHLDVDISVREIFRVLKPGGKLAVLEPLGTNPLINAYRRLTPASRTRGEHPLVAADLEKFQHLFPATETHYLHFLSVLAYFYRMIDGNERRFARLFAALGAVDDLLLRKLPPYRRLCWDVLLCCEKAG